MSKKVLKDKWGQLIPFEVGFEEKASGILIGFKNDFVTVFLKESISDAFVQQNGQPAKIVHLMVNWKAGLTGSDSFFHRMKRRIKDEICGPNCEQVELYPGEWRRKAFKQTHLWVLEPGVPFPLGFVPTNMREVSDAMGGSENLVTKEDIEFFVVVNGEYTEVFASKDEAIDAYSKNGQDEVPGEHSIVLMGNLPQESGGVGWSDGTKKKIANVLSKVTVVDDEPLPGDLDGVGNELPLDEQMRAGMEAVAERQSNHLRLATDIVLKQPDGGSDDMRPRIIIP